MELATINKLDGPIFAVQFLVGSVAVSHTRQGTWLTYTSYPDALYCRRHR